MEYYIIIDYNKMTVITKNYVSLEQISVGLIHKNGYRICSTIRLFSIRSLYAFVLRFIRYYTLL